MSKIKDIVKTKAIDTFTSDVVLTDPLSTNTNGSIHSLADVDIHSITERISNTYDNADIGTWAYSPSINYALYQASMEINRNEKETTLNILGQDAAVGGDGTVVMANRNQPDETASIDYITTFQLDAENNEWQGLDSTQQDAEVFNNGYYSGIDHGELIGIRHNDLYTQSYNLFYDDDNKLPQDKVTNVIKPTNINSIVAKTKQLFNDNKVNTIISAFHTDPNAPMKLGSARTSKYGMSHGRNLLLKTAERTSTGNYDIHGYDNPYCRVWTHHYQYNRRDRLIRPFVEFTDPERENTTSTDIAEWHNFGERDARWKDPNGGYAWKGGNVGWEKSVLHNDSRNGVVNIAPKYSNDPNHKSIKPIDCMFSIENLAWQGYDPYSFQKALSNEQRGPMGGRIMWFPPYDLKFSESVSVKWNPHDFVGRGESVHTYANTSRRGTLNFTILVDHPSYTDLFLQHDGEITTGKSTKVGTTDTDFLRFFAGCDVGGVPEPPRRIPDDEPVVPDEEPNPDDLMKFSFYVFYPNNYSGVHDAPGNTVEAIPYLLAGSGAQKYNNLKPAGALSEAAKNKTERLQSLKDWLKATYTDAWTGNGVTSVETIKDGATLAPIFKMVENIDEDKLLSNFQNDSTEPLAMFCGHYNSVSEFCSSVLKSSNSDLTNNVNTYSNSFNTSVQQKLNSVETKEKFSTYNECVFSEYALSMIEHDLNEEFGKPVEDLEKPTWYDHTLVAVTDMKNFLNNFVKNELTEYQSNLVSGFIAHKTSDANAWRNDINSVFDNFNNKIADYYTQSDIIYDTNGINGAADNAFVETYLVVDSKYLLNKYILDAMDAVTSYLITNNDITFSSSQGDYKKTTKLKEHFYFVPLTKNTNINDNGESEDDTAYDTVTTNGYNIYYIDNNGKEIPVKEIEYLDDDKDEVKQKDGDLFYVPDIAYKNYMDNASVRTETWITETEELSLPTMTDYCDINKLCEDLVKQIDELLPKYSQAGEIGDLYRGCFFTTPASNDKSKVAINYYDYDLGEWVSKDTQRTYVTDNGTTFMPPIEIDSFIENNGTINAEPNQVKYSEDLILYLNYYYGIMQLLGLDENFASKVQDILGSTQPTKENVQNNFDTYGQLIADKNDTERNPIYRYRPTAGKMNGYYMALDFNKKDEDFSDLTGYITEYVNGEVEDASDFICFVQENTPDYINSIVDYYNTFAGETKSFNKFANKNLYNEFVPDITFTDMMDCIFKTFYQLEKEIQATDQTAEASAYENSTEVSDDTDVPISMDKLSEATGVGYEMLKVIKNQPNQPTYVDVRRNGCCFGISNVQRDINTGNDKQTMIGNISITYDEVIPSNLNSGPFPEDSYNPNLTWAEISDNHIKGTRPNWQSYKSSVYVPKNQGLKNWDNYDYIPWYYRIDGKYTIPKSETEMYENYYDQFLDYNRIDKIKENSIVFSNYRDSHTFGLNCDIEMVKTAFGIKNETLTSNKETLYSLAEVAYTITDNQEIKDKIIEQGLILDENNAVERIEKLQNLLKYSKSTGNDKNDYEIVKIEALGYSNSHANNKSSNINKNRNDHLATNRAKTIVKWFKQNLSNLNDDVYNVGVTDVQISPSTSVGAEPQGINDVSLLKAKQYRSAKVTIYVKQNIDKDLTSGKTISYDYGGTKLIVDTTKSFEMDGMMFAPTSNENYFCHLTDKTLWVKENGVMKKVGIKKTLADTDETPIVADAYDTNILRYDNESKFFRELQIKDPIVFAKLVDKLQVFDPAFHSMTPEGFNARLTFLHQCTRQGDTHTLSDTNRTHTPKNLQFGKAPICILRLGDFYHQQILIESMSISYDDASWDLNTEGAGVQPMLAKIQLGIIFIGGGDLAGAVQRLQNAATFNYYANTRLYDNRADRVVYEEGNTGVIDTKHTYSHNVPYAGIDTRNYNNNKTKK